MRLRRDDHWSLDQADALNSYLDDVISRGAPSTGDRDPTLKGTVAQIHGLAERHGQTAAIKKRVWAEGVLASRAPAATATLVGSFPTKNATARPRSWESPRRRWRFTGQVAAAILLVIVLGVGYVTYRAVPGKNQPPTMPAAMIPGGTPNAGPGTTLPGCTVQPRPEGSVVALAGQRPTRLRQLPRYNDDPIHFDQRSAQVDGASLMGNRPMAPAQAINGIKATLAELSACRFYAYGPDGHAELDGRYFALFSEDYFRGELAGYREAGLDPTLHTFWMPKDTVPTIDAARLLNDGRVVVELQTESDPYHPEWRWITIFVQRDNRWLVDEVGEAKFPSAGTPPAGGPTQETPIVLDIALYDHVSVMPTIAATPPFVPTHRVSNALIILRAKPTTDSNPVAALPPATPLRWLTQEKIDKDGAKWMRFETATGEVGWIRAVDVGPPTGRRPQLSVCDPLSATPVPCGESYQRFGPYTYNEFPAGTDVTIHLYNAGNRAHRFVVKELGIDVNVKGGSEAAFVMNAPAGKYLFLIYEGGAQPIGAGVFEFIPADQRPSRG